MKWFIIFPRTAHEQKGHAIFQSSSHVDVRGKVTLEIAVAYYSEIPHSIRRFPVIFNFGALSLNKNIFPPFSYNLPRLLSEGRSLLKLLTLVILDSRGANVSFKTNFSLGAISLNKCKKLHNNHADLEVKVIHETRQQSILGMLGIFVSIDGVEHFGPFPLNKASGLPPYTCRE